MDAITLGDRINRLIKQNRPSWSSWAEECEREAWYGQLAGGIAEASIRSYPSAIAHYNAVKSRIISTDPNAAVPGGRVYFSIGQYGHTGTALGNGYFMNTSPRTTKQSVHDFGMGLYISKIADYASATGAKYLGSTAADFQLDAYGAGPTAGNQRQVGGTEARRRADATTASASLDPVLAAGSIGTFDGWKHGQSVNGNDVWFRGAYNDHNWFWSGAFTDTGTHDLQDMNPVVAPTSTSRTTALAANAREGSNTSAAVKSSVAAGQPVEMTGFVHGQSVTQNNITSDVWFFTKVSGYYMWAGSFTSQSTEGLTELTATTPPATAEPPSDTDGTKVNLDYKSFTADTPLATWIGSPNFGKRPAILPKNHITLHWMDGTLAGTDAQFQKIPTDINPPVVNGRSMGVATTYGVGPSAIHQYVKESEYHHGDGDAVSNATGISIEHEGGPNIPIQDGTYANSIRLCADIATRLNLGKLVLGVNVFPHNHWASTTCPGTLDMQRIVGGANALNYPDHTTPPATTDPEPTDGDGDDGTVIVTTPSSKADALASVMSTQVTAAKTLASYLANHT